MDLPMMQTLSVQPAKDIDGTELDTQTFDRYSISLAKTSQLPIHIMLKHFGQLLPKTPKSLAVPGPLFFSEQTSASDRISVNYVNFRTLNSLACVRLEFVSSISLHLELDENLKVLKVFRYPSLCRVFCSGSLDRDSYLTS